MKFGKKGWLMAWIDRIAYVGCCGIDKRKLGAISTALTFWPRSPKFDLIGGISRVLFFALFFLPLLGLRVSFVYRKNGCWGHLFVATMAQMVYYSKEEWRKGLTLNLRSRSWFTSYQWDVTFIFIFLLFLIWYFLCGISLFYNWKIKHSSPL